MSGELEAAGALATAGAVAGAIEGREPGQPAEGACANCGARVDGRYCAQCGQAAHANRSLGHLVGEFLHSIFHYDTKIWRTLPMAVFRPGTLTRNFVYGKRARYISPLALFLLAIFLMFFVFSFVDAPVEVAGSAEEQRVVAAERLEDSRQQLAEAQRELAEARAQPVDPDEARERDLALRLGEQAVSLAQAEVARREARLAAIDRTAAGEAETGASETAAADGAEGAAGQGQAAEGMTEEDMEGVSFMPGETWQDGFRRAAAKEDFTVIPGNPALNERVRQNFANPDLMLYKIQEAASKFSFLLAPLSLPFIALLFLWKRGVTLYDHVVYALYALSFAAFLFVAVMLTAQSTWTAWIAPWLVMVGLPAHTYFQLKGAYALGWFSALWRTFFMLTFACIILVVFLMLVIIVGSLG